MTSPTGAKSAQILLVGLLLLLVFSPIQTEARHPRRPKVFTTYLHEYLGKTNVALTNSTLGTISVVDQELRDGPVAANSTLVGKQVGMISFLSLPTIYAAFDFKIASAEYNGSFLIQGQLDLFAPTRTVAVIAGTGDFFLARGYATSTTISTGVPTVYKFVVKFKYT